VNNFAYRYTYPNNYYVNVPICSCTNMFHPAYWGRDNGPDYVHQEWRYPNFHEHNEYRLKDHGKEPFVININQAAKQNNTFRTALWTGKHLQVTLMRINPREDIGLEVHHDVDQFLRIEKGQGLVQMGENRNNLNYERRVHDDSAIMVPAGTWHNVTNTGNNPLKLYSIYAPPEHKFGTVHRTKAEAIAAEGSYGRSSEE